MTSELSWVYGDDAGDITASLNTDGGPQSLAGATIVAQVRNVATGVTQEVPASAGVTAGTVVISGAERATWPVGSHALRFRVTYFSGAVDIFPSDGSEPIAIVRAAWPVTP